jgi:hypothetical protein
MLYRRVEESIVTTAGAEARDPTCSERTSMDGRAAQETPLNVGCPTGSVNDASAV